MQAIPRTNARSHDPTQTRGIREGFSAECHNRLRDVKGLARTSLEENDALRLGRQYTNERHDQRDRRKQTQPASDFGPGGRAMRKAAFMEWLRTALNTEFLEPVRQRVATAGSHWSGTYIRASAQRGLQRAREALREAGYTPQGSEDAEADTESLLGSPAFQGALALAFLGTYQALAGVRDATEKEVARELGAVLEAGGSPREAADRVNDRIETVGLTRARVVANTEPVRAANRVALESYDRAGVDEVGVRVEVLTAQDNRVCLECQRLAENGPYPLSEAQGLLPQHPRCRCLLIPT